MASATRRRPNVVLILTDDMGFSDIGCFGSEISTPVLDGMAGEGVRLTQMYNAARCCPTRASLLTGLYPHQAGIGHMTGDYGEPGYRGFLSDSCVTIAEALRAAGYRTYMSGKWHVGGPYGLDRSNWRRAGQPGWPRPVDRGFDHHFGTLDGCASYFDPHTLMADGERVSAVDPDFYYTEAIGRQAASAVERYARTNEPFFAYVAFTSPHWPLHAMSADIERYRGRYRAGWDRLRGERLERLRELGILSSTWPLSPRHQDAPPWDDVGDRDWEDARMAVYAAQVDSMDRSVGYVLDALQRTGIARDTIVLFLSDNGGCAELLEEEGGWVQDLVVPHTRDGRPVRVGNSREILPGDADTYMSYDLPWANLSNTPFRLFKHWVHEGGISTPCIVRWPGVLPAGAIVHEPCSIIDVLPTFLDATRAAYPEERDGVPVTPVAGDSLLPLLTGGRAPRARPLLGARGAPGCQGGTVEARV